MLNFACDHCGKKLAVKDHLAGKRVKCPGCGQATPTPAVTVSASSGSHTPRVESVPEDSVLIESVAPDSSPPDSARLDDSSAPPTGEEPTHPPSQGPEPTRDFPPATRPEDEDDEEGPSLTDFLTPPERPDEIGRLGGYRILKILGHGGMGVVYRAEDPSLERLVALKAMLPVFVTSKSAKARFVREAKAAAAIKHDHIVSIYQVGEDRGAPFLAMELLEGEALDARLAHEKSLPAAEIMRIGRQIAEGLAAAHSRGLIHRDIKPANIWLEGAKARVKILDFGLARSVSDPGKLTRHGAVIGTPAYMSPEQAAGHTVDPRSDLFSLGCVLYRMATGAAAFQGSDTLAILSALAIHSPSPPSEVNPRVPPALSEFIMRLLAKRPDERPPSAQAVADELEALSDPATALSAATAIRSAAPTTVARPRLKTALAALGILVVAVAGLCFVLLSQEQGGGVKKEASIPPSVKPVLAPHMLTPPGPREFALAFDGNALVNLTTLTYDASHPLTMECWFKIDRFSEFRHQNLISEGPLGFHFGIENEGHTWDCLIHRASGTPSPLAGDAALPVGRLIHAALVLDGGDLRLYQDGKLIAEAKGTGGHVPSTAPIILGNVLMDGEGGADGKGATKKSADKKGPDKKGSSKGSKGPGKEGFTGQLYDVRFSKSARYRGDFQPPPRLLRDDDTWALHRCDEGAGQTIIDYSGYGHDGKIVGATWVKVKSD